MFEFFDRLFESSFMPHGHCYQWRPELVWLHAGSDALIALSYYLIPFLLVYFVAKRKDLEFRWVFVLFGAFIFLCGTTHLLEVWSIWNGTYRLTGTVKLVTAGVSLATAFILIPFIPRALGLPSPTQLESTNEALRREIVAREETERALRESEARFRLAFDAAAIGKALVSPDGRWLQVNPALCRLVGYEADELLRLTFQDITHPEDLQVDLDHLRQVIDGRQDTYQMEKRYIRKDGQFVWIHLSVGAVREDDGGVKYLVVEIKDITQRRAAEEQMRELNRTLEQRVSERTARLEEANQELHREIEARREAEMQSARLAAIVEYSEDAITRQTLDGVVTDWNPSAERLYGYSAGEAIGQPIDLIASPSRHEEAAHLIRQARRGQAVQGYETVRRTKAGVEIDISLTISAIRDREGAVVGLSTIERDVTHRKEAERELHALNETLELRIENRTQALSRANRVLEQRNRELQDFAYVASHDLQEPLRKIGAFSDLIRGEYEAVLDEDGCYYLERIQDSALRMSRLLNDLLAFSRVMTHGRPFGRVDLNEVAESVLADLELKIAEIDARVEVGRLPRIEADHTQMHRLLVNLVGNALKFRLEGRRPVVEIDASVEPGADGRDECVLVVRDNGIGFDGKYDDRIFMPFERLHGRSAYPGTGMGLAICRRIVERHHGTIEASGREGEGATFTIRLPVEQVAGEEDEPDTEAPETD